MIPHPTPSYFTTLGLGDWLASKARLQQAEKGTQQAARNLKKQGVPLELALRLLARKH